MLNKKGVVEGTEHGLANMVKLSEDAQKKQEVKMINHAVLFIFTKIDYKQVIRNYAPERGQLDMF